MTWYVQWRNVTLIISQRCHSWVLIMKITKRTKEHKIIISTIQRTHNSETYSGSHNLGVLIRESYFESCNSGVTSEYFINGLLFRHWTIRQKPQLVRWFWPPPNTILTFPTTIRFSDSSPVWCSTKKILYDPLGRII